MFTRNEKKLLWEGYFTILREENRFIEVRSNNTGHCWIIFKKVYDKKRPITLYHKHAPNKKWYHEHWRGGSVKAAVTNIVAHDEYVLGTQACGDDIRESSVRG